MFQQHLQRAMTHLPLNPVERFVLLQRQDREAVTALPDWSVWNFSSRENPTPHRVGRPAIAQDLNEKLKAPLEAAAN